MRANYSFSPKSNQGTLGEVCNDVCPATNPDLFCGPPPDATGVVQYTMNNFTTFSAPTIKNILNEPPTTIGEVSTTNSLDHTISENVSYSQDDGAEVGVSNSVSVSHSTSFSTPEVTTSNFSLDGSNGNNAKWTWSVGESADARDTFTPNFQWIWEAAKSTRASGSILWQQQFAFTAWPYSCFLFDGTSTSTEASLKLAIPIPPLPKSCTTNQDCGVGQVCATDFTPSVCAAKACGPSNFCPPEFECINELCEKVN